VLVVLFALLPGLLLLTLGVLVLVFGHQPHDYVFGILIVCLAGTLGGGIAATFSYIRRTQSLARLQAEFDQNAAKGGRDGATFAIEVDGKYIGGCGLFGFSETDRTAELGIGIGDKAYWNKGYGREAVGLLLDYAFRLRNWRRVWLRVWGNNERGIRAYRACGFVEEGRLRDHVWSAGAYYDLVVMGILREEWEGRVEKQD